MLTIHASDDPKEFADIIERARNTLDMIEADFKEEPKTEPRADDQSPPAP